LWIMLYAYAFRLFFDFSGYTDIAIGIALLAGIHLPENFSAPYLKRNITAFWNSWHITLATWFRNYFFTPLSRALMATRLRSRRMLIILIAQVSTMVLIGLWHGIALNFVLWGAWHGLGLWLHRWQVDHSQGWDAYVAKRPRLARAVHLGSVLATFHFVAIGWVFFALPDPALIGKTLAGLVGLHV
ncbi:MAG TPA: MBOAT family O-acyltransferase, partial [Aggregatilineales bacterium]|nr:MBOAT family O-acyltransferase [Aggregatilineales bacterium]